MTDTAPQQPRDIRVLVTASRNLRDRQPLADALLDTWHDAIQIYGPEIHLTVVHGACPDGGDEFADEWALQNEQHGVSAERIPADWDECASNCPSASGHRRTKKPGDTAHPGLLDTYCPGAGPRRNAEAVRRGADVCIAAPLGVSYGTRGCMRLAEAAGIPIRMVISA